MLIRAYVAILIIIEWDYNIKKHHLKLKLGTCWDVGYYKYIHCEK